MCKNGAPPYVACNTMGSAAFVRLHLNKRGLLSGESSRQFRSAYSLHNGQLWQESSVFAFPSPSTTVPLTPAPPPALPRLTYDKL